MTMKKLFGISLALLMLAGSTPLGFSDPLQSQIEQGIETEKLHCDNKSLLLVQRTNGKLACVTEKTSEKLGWEILTTSNVLKTSDKITKENKVKIICKDCARFITKYTNTEVI